MSIWHSIVEQPWKIHVHDSHESSRKSGYIHNKTKHRTTFCMYHLQWQSHIALLTITRGCRCYRCHQSALTYNDVYVLDDDEIDILPAVLCYKICIWFCFSFVLLWLYYELMMDSCDFTPWWRHQMETSSALLAICAGNSPVTGEFPAQRPVTRSFDVFLDLRLNKRLSK